MSDHQSISFIGLGMMGVPMVENLIQKTSDSTKIYVYDVVKDSIRQLCSRHPDRVQEVAGAREAAENAVCRNGLSIFTKLRLSIS
jgi:3-hydroxyisobutyrate dehydrogenase-like beta-hydroxyacid dehydrogenase